MRYDPRRINGTEAVQRITRLGSLLAIIVLVWAPAPSAAQPATGAGMAPEAFAAIMPRAFGGFFRWRSGGGLQTWLIQFEQVKPLGDGSVEATGQGTNIAGQSRTQVDVRAVIDPATLRLEMWESNPRGGDLENYVTDGTYRGRLSEDLRRLEAGWSSEASDNAGDLIMIANDEESRT